MKETKNIVWHEMKVDKGQREKSLGQKGILIWLTGLSGSGKSTVGSALEHRLYKAGRATYLLDGDNVRHGLNSDLGFSERDRTENIRRIGEVAKLFVDAGIITIATFVSPFKNDRTAVRNLIGEGFVEVHVDCDIKTCMNRDPKGLYKKAVSGEISEFTGISSPYEIPEKPEVTVNTASSQVEECVDRIIAFIEERYNEA